MTPGWLRRRSRRTQRGPVQQERPSLNGCPLLLRRLDDSQEGALTLDVLSKRYEVEALDSAAQLFRVDVDDARFPDEAVVRLASALDELDRNWGERFAWPKVAE